MKKYMVVALAAASCAFGSGAASAAAVTDYLNGVLIGSWTQSLAPKPVDALSGQYTVVAISNGTGAAFGNTTATWYSAPPGSQGGLLVGDSLTSLINSTGPQSYTGSELAPSFAPGVFFEDDGSIVTISVPEPATWAMMLVGMGMIGLAVRRRQAVTVAYA